jgi:preprotein translocase subunit SecG
MNTIFTVVIVIQVLSALTIIGLVLLQHGKGADMGAAFGSGASGSLFGATGSSNFLSKSTGVAAAVFFAATLALAYMGNQRSTVSGGVMDRLSPATLIAPPASTPASTGSAPAAAPAAPASDTQGQSNQIPK